MLALENTRLCITSSFVLSYGTSGNMPSPATLAIALAYTSSLSLLCSIRHTMLISDSSDIISRISCSSLSVRFLPSSDNARLAFSKNLADAANLVLILSLSSSNPRLSSSLTVIPFLLPLITTELSNYLHPLFNIIYNYSIP